MERFRLAVVDGFAGGGQYHCGNSGSPLIFVEELKRAVEAVNARRSAEGLGPVEIECLFIPNDFSRDAIETLKSNLAPLQAEISADVPRLHLRVEYLNLAFEEAYPQIKQLLEQGRYRNVLFNLDQCGHSKVRRATLVDIMRSYQSVEIFYTFAIQTLLTYLQTNDPVRLANQLQPFEISVNDLQSQTLGMNKHHWLGAAERLVFDSMAARPMSALSRSTIRTAGAIGSSISPTLTGRGRSITISCTPTVPSKRIMAGPACICCLMIHGTRMARSTCSIPPDGRAREIGFSWIFHV
jgi:three-Cys-motif partner protein